MILRMIWRMISWITSRMIGPRTALGAGFRHMFVVQKWYSSSAAVVMPHSATVDNQGT